MATSGPVRIPRRPYQTSSAVQWARSSGSCSAVSSRSARRPTASAMPMTAWARTARCSAGEVDVDHLGHRVGHVLEHGLGHLGELGVVADGGAEEQPERRLVAGDEAEVGGHAVLDPLPARCRPAPRRP